MKQLIEQTTQYRHWRFDAETIQKTRIDMHEKAVANAKSNLEIEQKLANKPPVDIEFITLQDQLDLTVFFQSKVFDYAKVYKYDHNVQATAIMFFKRFYLTHSIIDYDPKLMLITALYLATKAESIHITLETFLKKIPKAPTPQQVLDFEFKLCKGVKFEFMIHHPFWPLHGFFLDIQTYLQKSSSKTNIQSSFKKLVQCYTSARESVFTSLLSDLHFTLWPSQIAMSCLLTSAKKFDFLEDLNAYFKSRLESELGKASDLSPEPTTADEVYEKLLAKLNAAEGIIQKTSVPDKSKALMIDQKLQKCKNPEFIDTSLLYAQKRKVAEEEHEEKQVKRIKLETEREEELSVFL